MIINQDSPIAVFDSGIGGISVLKELIDLMPNENYIFLGDSANAPYGTRSLDDVKKLSSAHIKALIDEGVKEVVIACNTATSAAAAELRCEFADFPIIGIEPALKPAVLSKPMPTVAVLATPLTLREEKFRLLLGRYSEQATVHSIPCAGLVELIENGVFSGKELDDYLADVLKPYENVEFDAVVLGCTHYPHVKAAIQKAFGGNVKLFDGGEGTAREARRQLALRGLLRDSESKGSLELRFTKDSDRMKDLSLKLLGK